MENGRIISLFPSGIVTPPPSKSLCHRAVICAALAATFGSGGESVIENMGSSEDISATLSGVGALGADWRLDNNTLRVFSGSEMAPKTIDCGESGSTLRFLLPLAALKDTQTAFTGRGRLMERPLDAYAAAFSEGGAEFLHTSREVRVKGPLQGGVYTLPGDVSSQFVSGLLFALPLLERDSEIRLATPLDSRHYVDLTVDVMKRFGVEVIQAAPSLYRVGGGQRYRPARYSVEADYSQAAFFLAAAALGREVKCSGLNPESRQGDRAILEILRDMGADIIWENGDVKVNAKRLSAVTVDAREIPDLIPPVAALCCFCEGTSKIVNAGRLRLKESDRLGALRRELGNLGAAIEEGPDSLTITGSSRLRGGRADAHGDHRIAMAAAVAALGCEEPVELTGWRSVSKSYPGFWADFEKEVRHA